jgi:ATP-dependent helicase/nuclease subunit B
VSGFSEFKIPETEFLALFAKNDVPFALNLEYSDRNGPLFGNLEDNIMALINAGFASYRTFDDKDLDQEKIEISSFLKRWLFYQNRSAPKNPEFSEMIKIIEINTRAEEVKYIAKLVKYLAIEKKIPLHRMCIVMRQPTKYTNLFREVFSQNLIPMNISDRFDLKTSPITTAVFAILDTVTKHFRRDDVHRALLNTYFSFRDQNGRELDGNNLYSTALQLRMEGGKPRAGKEYWTNKLESELKEYESRLKTLDPFDFEDEIEIINTKRLIRSIEKALKDFKAFISIIPSNTKKLTPSDFVNLIKEDILNKLNVRKNIVDFYKHIEKNKDKFSSIEYIQFQEKAEKDARAFTALLDLLEEMKYVLNDLYPKATFSLEELSERFKTSVSAKKYQIREKFNHGINITAIEQTRGIPYDVMILCGAVEGEFPIAYSPETFLGKELKDTELRHIKSECMLFYQFLTNSIELLNLKQHQLYITYFKDEGETQIPRSSFVNSLIEISTLEKDNKIYNINNIIKSIENNDQVAIKQYKDIPWIFSISNENEKLCNYAKELLTIDPINNIDEKKYSKEYQKTRHAIFVENFLENSRNNNRFEIDIENLSEEAREKLKSITDKPFSVSVLDNYASCPFKYFMNYFVRLTKEEDYDNTLSPIEWGNLIHKVLYLFYTELQNEEEHPEIELKANRSYLPIIKTVNLDRKNHDYYLDKLNRITKNEISKFHIDNKFFVLQKEMIFSDNNRMGFLELLLNNEYDKQNKDWKYMPGLFEFSFGIYASYSSENKIENVELSPKLKIRGKIDRVEFAETENGLECLIVDYKSSTGSVPSNTDIFKGHGFQIPLYMLAIEKILLENYGVNIDLMGGYYYSLKPKYDKKKNSLDCMKPSLIPQNFDSTDYFTRSKIKEELREVLDDSLYYAENIAENIRQAKFPVEPYNSNICRNCELNPICRIAEKKFDLEIAEEEIS